MKILEINKYYFANGGADKHFLDLVSLLEAKGNEVAVFSMKHPKNLESKWSKYFLSTAGYDPNYAFREKIKGLARMFYSFEAKRKINKLLDDFRPDIAHIHNIYHQISPSILPEIKKRGIPVIMTVHDYKLICPNYLLIGENYGFWKFVGRKCFKESHPKSFLVALEWHFHKFLKIYEKNIDLYVVPSQFVKNKLIKHEIRKEKIFTLPHFSNLSQSSILGSIGVSCKTDKASAVEKFALYAGRISKEKGADTLVDIFKKIKNIKLYLAGEIESGFKNGDSENIRFLGHLDKNKLADYIKGASFIVSGSRLPETFGLTALDAISAGKPFFGFRTGAFPEIIQNGKNGFLVENEKEFIRVLKNFLDGNFTFNSREIGDSAQKKYNPDNFYRQFSQILKMLERLDPARSTFCSFSQLGKNFNKSTDSILNHKKTSNGVDKKH